MYTGFTCGSLYTHGKWMVLNALIFKEGFVHIILHLLKIYFSMRNENLVQSFSREKNNLYGKFFDYIFRTYKCFTSLHVWGSYLRNITKLYTDSAVVDCIIFLTNKLLLLTDPNEISKNKPEKLYLSSSLFCW